MEFRYQRDGVGVVTALTVTAEIAETLSRRYRCRMIGVWPRGAQVRRTLGINRNPHSSRNTRWAFRRSAFFLPRPSDTVSSAQWLPHRARERGARVSGTTNRAW